MTLLIWPLQVKIKAVQSNISLLFELEIIASCHLHISKLSSFKVEVDDDKIQQISVGPRLWVKVDCG